LVTNVVLPELHLFVDSLNRDLVPEFEKIDNRRYLLDIDKQHFPEIKEDELAMANVLAQCWWLTPNQKLKKQGFSEVDDPNFNSIWIPNNLTPVSAVGDDMAAAQLASVHKP
jgi:hypothetical protein